MAIKKEEPEEKLSRDQILALDIATHCGYQSIHDGGTWNFTESKRRNNNKQHEAFRETLIDYIEKHGIKQIVAEDVNVNNHFIDARKLSEFRGIMFEVCDTYNLRQPVFINTMTLKKFATGDGHADKSKMINFCKLRWKIDPVDDNQADAAHLLFCFIKRFNL